MRGLVLFILTASASARAEQILTLKSVNALASGVTEFRVVATKAEPVVITVARGETSGKQGSYEVTLKTYPGADRRDVTLAILRRAYVDKGSLYVLRRNANQNFDVLNAKPITDNATSIDQDLAETFRALKFLNQCSEAESLLGLVEFAKLWPTKDLESFRTEAGNAHVKRGETSCAEPLPPPGTVAKPKRPAAPARVPRPQGPFDGEIQARPRRPAPAPRSYDEFDEQPSGYGRGAPTRGGGGFDDEF